MIFEGTSAVKEILSGHDLADFEVIIRKVDTDSTISHETTLKLLRDMSETRIMIDATVRGTFNFFRAAHGLQMLLPSYQYIVLNPVRNPSKLSLLFRPIGFVFAGRSRLSSFEVLHERRNEHNSAEHPAAEQP